MALLRIGILSAAGIAPRALIEPATTNDEVEIAAVAARDPERAREFAAEHGIGRVFTSYEELLASPEIDAVYIPTPNGLHGRWTIAALEAGKHVLCEKPFTANAAEAREVAAVAEQSDLVVMEAFHNLYHPVTTRMREIIESGELGSIQRYEADFGFSIVDDPGNVRWQPHLAGGSLMDVGCYPLQLLRRLSGSEPTVTRALAHEFTPGVDGDMTIDLAFPGGATGTASSSMVLDPPEMAMSATIAGDAGMLTVSRPFLPQLGTEIVVTTGAGERREPVSEETSYAFQLRAFADAVLRGAPVLTGPVESIALMGLIDDAYRAAGLEPRHRSTE